MSTSQEWKGTALLYSGRMDEALEVYTALAGQSGPAHVWGLVGMALLMPVVGRVDEARELADEAVTAARLHGSPHWTCGALSASGRALADIDPPGALAAIHEALALSRDHRITIWEAALSREAAGLEAVHGDPGAALEMFDTAVGLLQRAGDVGNVAVAFADMAVLFDRLAEPDIAATLYGAAGRHGDIGWVLNLPSVVERLRETLGERDFDDCVAAGAGLDIGAAVNYAQQQVRSARETLSRQTEPTSAVPSRGFQGRQMWTVLRQRSDSDGCGSGVEMEAS
jgi:hypothetical protein